MDQSRPRKRKALDLKEKFSILEDVDKGIKKNEIASHYNIPPSTLSTIIKQREAILSEWEKCGSTGRKKLRSSPVEDVEHALETWFTQQRAFNIPISGVILAEKAREFACALKFPDFKASNGFLDRFKKRHGLTSRTVSGEAMGANEDAAIAWRQNVFPTYLQRYNENDIYNADETGLFYQCLPNQTLALKGEKCIGGKISKRRVTILFCTNMTGTDKRKLLLIGNSQKPRCFKNIKKESLPVTYCSNRKAWMDSETWKQWLSKFDADMMRAGRKVLLIVDNVSSHKALAVTNLHAIELAFLPPTTTSHIQPLDQGIIKTFKTIYRSKILRRLLLWVEAKKDLQSFGITIFDCVQLSSRAWSEVDTQTIVNCFHHAGFQHDPFPETIDNSATGTSESTLNETRNIFTFLANNFGMDGCLEDFLGVDELVSTEGILQDSEILEKVGKYCNSMCQILYDVVILCFCRFVLAPVLRMSNQMVTIWRKTFHP